MQIRVFTLNSFAKTPDGGNPAGVVLDADDLSEQQMLFIAGKVGFSETAFMQHSDKADFCVRFFTPTAEVDLCGHATIATYALLWHQGKVVAGKYSQETKAGILGITVGKDGTIYMNQSLPQYFDQLDKAEIARSLNIPIDDIAEDLPVQIVSTGLRDILVPIKTLDKLLLMRPDQQQVAAISEREDAVGYHAFTLETKFGSSAHCRNFAPLYEIPEEAATGTSNGALASYLFHYGKLDISDVSKLIFEQGYSMDRPSEILAKLEIVNNQIQEVVVGGKAVISGELEIEI